MFAKIIDLNNSEAFVISDSDIIKVIPISYVNNNNIGDKIFIPSSMATSSNSYINTTNNLI